MLVDFFALCVRGLGFRAPWVGRDHMCVTWALGGGEGWLPWYPELEA